MADKKISRRKARVAALTHLYQIRMGQEEPEPLPEDKLITGICNGVAEHRDAIDQMIMPRLKNWSIDRLAIIDHIILQIAICEMIYMKNAPKVVINEAIELCKSYSTPESGSFINGILDNLMKEKDCAGQD